MPGLGGLESLATACERALFLVALATSGSYKHAMPGERTTAAQISLGQALLDQALVLRREIATAQKQITAAQKALSGIENALVEINGTTPLPAQTEIPFVSASGFRAAKSLNQGLQFLLEDENRPMTPMEMVSLVGRYGKHPPQEKPSWKLSNIMSMNHHIYHRVEWRGIMRWWLKGKPVPLEYPVSSSA